MAQRETCEAARGKFALTQTEALQALTVLRTRIDGRTDRRRLALKAKLPGERSPKTRFA